MCVCDFVCVVTHSTSRSVNIFLVHSIWLNIEFMFEIHTTFVSMSVKNLQLLFEFAYMPTYICDSEHFYTYRLSLASMIYLTY